jgi:hypothetical protein
MKKYNIFISHSWAYSDAYDRIIELLDEQGLNYKNHSVPKNDPLHTRGTDKELERAIRNQMSGTHCVLIMAGVYSTYSKWINKEIAIAVEMQKPIIAIKPWSQTNLSSVVQKYATVIVGWNGKSIADAIKEQSI